MNRHALLALAPLLVLSLPLPAAACGGLACQPPTVALGAVVDVPANAPGVRLDRGFEATDGPETLAVRLFALVDGEWVEQAVELDGDVIVPAVGFAPETTYRVEVEGSCFEEPVVDAVELHTGLDAALPDALGRIEAGAAQTGSVPVPTSAGSCYEETSAVYADVSVELDPSARPWAGLLVWTTYVDGLPYRPSGTISPENPFGNAGGYGPTPGGSWRGAGVDRIYAACAAASPGAWTEGVDQGLHEVVLRATIPGADVVLETEAVLVELRCGPASYEPDPCPSGLYGPQGACHPVGEPLPSAGASGCSASGASRPGGAVALAMALALLWTRRRGASRSTRSATTGR